MEYPKLQQLRRVMNEQRIDVYIIGTHDPHQSEYLSDYYKTRQWISGFTGSQGIAVVTMNDALLWTDGRYFVQAANEIESSGFKLMKMDTPGYPNYKEWLADNIEIGSVIGIFDSVFPQNELEELMNMTKDKSVLFSKDKDLIGMLWNDRPFLPTDPMFIVPDEYTGETAKNKIERVRKEMLRSGCDGILLSTLDDVAWLYNIRGRDLPKSLMVMSYAIVTEGQANLYVDQGKLTPEVRSYLEENDVQVKRYYGVFESLESLEVEKLWIDKNATTVKLYDAIPERVQIFDSMLPTTYFKAVKNATEINNLKKAYEMDAAALIKHHLWLRMELAEGKEITEFQSQEKLEEIRRTNPDYLGESFNTISAYRDNAAMMHYSASKHKSSFIKSKGFYLVDAGAQFFEGTTDTTRTIALGELTSEEKRDYTLVLKAHINLSRAIFLEGTTGHALDVIARYPIWQYRMDYKSGTGHGIGFVLNVHEGPHRISKAYNDVALIPGMVTSNEPGIYKEGKHGIRLENILVVVEDESNQDGQFYKFETISFIPFDRRAIEKDLLTKEEIEWLNCYHEEVCKRIAPYLTQEEQRYLLEETKAI